MLKGAVGKCHDWSLSRFNSLSLFEASPPSCMKPLRVLMIGSIALLSFCFSDWRCSSVMDRDGKVLLFSLQHRLHDCSPVHHNTHDLRNRHRLPSQITVTKRIHHQSLSSPYHPPYLPKPSLPLQLAVFQKRENEQGSRVFHTDSVQDNIDSWGQLLSCCVIPTSSWIQHHSPQVRVKRGVITHLFARHSNQFFMCF